MTGHFFLEGPIQIGKSTLIRRLLSQFMKDHGLNPMDIGGFSSQRLLDRRGNTAGFRLASVEEAMSLTRLHSEDLKDIFLDFTGPSIRKTPEVFSNMGLKYLQDRGGKKLILLDEIGGMELLVPEFRDELYRVLEGDIPCLGVLKLGDSNRNMCRVAGIENRCTDYNGILRQDILNRFKGNIIHFTGEHGEEIQYPFSV